VPVARVMADSRVSEPHGANAPPLPVHASHAANFPAALGNAVNTQETPENTMASPQEAMPQASDLEVPGPDGAASDPPGAPATDPAHRSPGEHPTTLAAPGPGSREPSGSLGDIFESTLNPSPDGAREELGPLNGTGALRANSPGGPGQKPGVDHHSSRNRRIAETTVLDAAWGMLGVMSASITPGGDPASTAAGNASSEGAAAAPLTRLDRPLPSVDAETGPESKWDAAARSAASPDPKPQHAIDQGPSPSAAPVDPTHASHASFEARSTSSGPGSNDANLLDHMFAAAQKTGSGVTLAAAALHLASRTGGEATHGDPAGITAASAPGPVANSASAGPALPSSAQSSGLIFAPEDFADRLSTHVIGSIKSPDHDVVLHLHPPELGDLTVRVAVSGREVSAWFAAPQVLVQQAISQAIGQLHTDLGNAGYNLTGAWVGADGSSSRERNGRLSLALQERHSPVSAELVTTPAPPSGSVSLGVSIYV
jgi:Flagellar hook-length control protein FliK